MCIRDSDKAKEKHKPPGENLKDPAADGAEQVEKNAEKAKEDLRKK